MTFSIRITNNNTDIIKYNSNKLCGIENYIDMFHDILIESGFDKNIVKKYLGEKYGS